jgi:hypothetical protein
MARRWFGPSQREIWRQLSEAVGGRYLEGGFRRSTRVEVTHSEWTVTLDTYAVSTGKVTIVYTRMRAPYVNPEGFRFTIYRRGVFSDVGKFFGMQDVEVADPAFDHDFIVKGTDEGRLRSLFSSAALRELVKNQPQIHLSVKDDEGWFGAKFPEGVDMLTFAVPGVIKDIERLKALFELFAMTLDELCRIGAAYARDPEVAI